MTKKINLSVQIQEVKTELEFRKQVYARRKIQQPRDASTLDYRMEIMQAVLGTLQWLYTNEDDVRAFIEEQKKKA